MIFFATYLAVILGRTTVAQDAVSLSQLLKQPAVAAQLDLLTHSRETLNRVEVIHPSAESLSLRRQLINEASTFTFITMPFWYNDKSGASLVNALLTKSHNSPDFEYRLIQDWISPLYSKGGLKIYDRLSPNVVLWNSPLWQRRFSYNLINSHVHDKYFIVDGTKMIIGSTNINDEHLQGGETEKGWHDTDIYVEGPAVPIATENYIKIWQLSKYLASSQSFPPFRDQEILALQKYFYENQEDHDFTTVKSNRKPGDPATENHPVHIELKKYLSDPKYFPTLPANPTYTTPLRVVYDNALINRDAKTKKEYSNIRRAVEFLLKNAQSSAWFYVPYLTLDKDFAAFLENQARRIKINVITNSAETYDVSKKAYRGQLSHYEDLIKSGVTIYEWQGNEGVSQLRKKGIHLLQPKWPGHTLHTKMILIDHSVVALGSENFNGQSFKHNNEELSIINDGKTAARVDTILDQDLHPERQGIAIQVVKLLTPNDVEILKAKFNVTHPIWKYPPGM